MYGKDDFKMPKIKLEKVVSKKRTTPPDEYDEIFARFKRNFREQYQKIKDKETFDRAWEQWTKTDERLKTGQSNFLKKARNFIISKILETTPEKLGFTEKGIVKGKVVPARVQVIIVLRDIEGHRLKFTSKRQEAMIKKKLLKIREP